MKSTTNAPLEEKSGKGLLSRFAFFIRRLDLDTKLTIAGFVLLLVTWIIDLFQTPSSNRALLIIIGLLVLSFFLLTTSENLKSEQRLSSLVRDELLKTLFDRVDLKEDLLKAGIQRINLGRDYGRIARQISETSKEIKLMGITIYAPLFTLRSVLIESMSRNNYDLKVLISTKKSPFLLAKEKEENIIGRLQNEVSGTSKLLQEIYQEASYRGYTGKIQIAFYSSMVYCTLYIIDDRLAIYNPYVYFERGVELPVFEIENTPTGTFRVYSNHFERVWKSTTEKIVFPQDVSLA